MGLTGTQELYYKTNEFEIKLTRPSHGKNEVVVQQTDPFHYETQAQKFTRTIADIPPSLNSLHEQPKESKISDSGVFVTSPMVGTFYTASAPDAPPLVKVGDTIHKDTVVCIIEAMKVMNEVKAGVSGTVTEVLVENGHPVEFGTKLFSIS